jgi:hypothetical protein
MKKNVVIGPKPQTVLEYLKKAFHEAFVAPFVKDKRVPMSYSERLGFINQVKELERDAIRKI